MSRRSTKFDYRASVTGPLILQEQTEIILVFTTCPDAASAGRIAERLVTDRLAACVNMIPGVRSVFEWEGKTEHSEEIVLLIKTTALRYKDVETAIQESHPYELPEVLSVPVERGSPPYLRWIEENIE